MMRPLLLTIAIATTAFQLAACDDGARAEAALARARDSSLASDLRLARGEPARSAPNASTTRVASYDAATTVTESPGSIDATLPNAAANVSAEGFIGPSCASPALPDQRRCLTSYLARSDVALDRNYQLLISALKREAGKQPGDREPPTVLRLRTAQRNWLVYRDDECRRRNEGAEGTLWAPIRAKCLTEYSDQRSKELANALTGRGGTPSAVKAAPTRTVAKTVTTKRAKAAKRARRHRR